MKKYLYVALSVIICEAAGLVSTPLTVSSIRNWYIYLNKPFFSPPNWIFGPVWTTLYFLMGVSAYLVFKKGFKKKNVKQALFLFGIQLFLNAIWSIIFFGFRSPLAAFIEIMILWLAIIATMVQFNKISKAAMYLLIPYIIWVSFAAMLNFSIVILN